MDVFIRNLRSLACCAAIGAAGMAGGQQTSVSSRIEVSAEDGVTYDASTSRVEFRGFRLSAGEIRIEAVRAVASTFDLEESDWQLDGNVRITVGSVEIEGDSSRFAIRDGELSRFELAGEPATFTDLSTSGSRRASGGASRLLFDTAEQQLSLTENAWLSVGSNEVIGCDLIYDLDAQPGEPTFRSGSAECDQPFRIRISPVEDEGADSAPQSP